MEGANKSTERGLAIKTQMQGRIVKLQTICTPQAQTCDTVNFQQRPQNCNIAPALNTVYIRN